MKHLIKTLCGCAGREWVARVTETIKREAQQDVYIADAVVCGESVIALMVKGVVVDWVGRDYRDGINEGVGSLRLVKVMQMIRGNEVDRRMEDEGVNDEMIRLGMIPLLEKLMSETQSKVTEHMGTDYKDGKEACYE